MYRLPVLAIRSVRTLCHLAECVDLDEITLMHWFGRICSISRPGVWGKLLTRWSCWHYRDFPSSELSTQPEWPKCRKAKAKSTPCFRTWFVSHRNLVLSRSLISCPLSFTTLFFLVPSSSPASSQCLCSMICRDLWSVHICPLLSTLGLRQLVIWDGVWYHPEHLLPDDKWLHRNYLRLGESSIHIPFKQSSRTK